MSFDWPSTPKGERKRQLDGDSVPQSPPSSGKHDIEAAKDSQSKVSLTFPLKTKPFVFAQKPQQNEADAEWWEEDDSVTFDCFQIFEDFSNFVTRATTSSRLALKLIALFMVYGNLFAFLGLFTVRSFPMIDEYHSSTIAIVSKIR